ncbi:unnamed protein product, partial [Rotaria sordida]
RLEFRTAYHSEVLTNKWLNSLTIFQSIAEHIVILKHDLSQLIQQLKQCDLS